MQGSSPGQGNPSSPVPEHPQGGPLLAVSTFLCPQASLSLLCMLPAQQSSLRKPSWCRKQINPCLAAPQAWWSSSKLFAYEMAVTSPPDPCRGTVAMCLA